MVNPRNDCYSDWQCPRGKKCCKTFCGRRCISRISLSYGTVISTTTSACWGCGGRGSGQGARAVGVSQRYLFALSPFPQCELLRPAQPEGACVPVPPPAPCTCRRTASPQGTGTASCSHSKIFSTAVYHLLTLFLHSPLLLQQIKACPRSTGVQFSSSPPCFSRPIPVHIPRCIRAVGWGVRPVLWNGGAAPSKWQGHPHTALCWWRIQTPDDELTNQTQVGNRSSLTPRTESSHEDGPLHQMYPWGGKHRVLHAMGHSIEPQCCTQAGTVTQTGQRDGTRDGMSH